MPRSFPVLARTRRHDIGYDLLPVQDEVKRLIRAGRPPRKIVYRLQAEFGFVKGKGMEHGPATATAKAAQEGAEIALAAVAPALRCSKLNPDRGATDDLVQAFTLERSKHATDRGAFEALARLDILIARKTPDKAPWMRLTDAKRLYGRAVHGDTVTVAEVGKRADALERRYRRAIKDAKHRTAKT